MFSSLAKAPIARTCPSQLSSALNSAVLVAATTQKASFTAAAAPSSNKMAGLPSRGSHPDFKPLEASRPDFDASAKARVTKTPDPNWQHGSGPNHLEPASVSASKKHIAVDPYADGRSKRLNYKLLISAVSPRPVAFVSTLNADGTAPNLAPFSYFNVINNDPAIFVVGFSCSIANAKDTLKNILETKECVINIISEQFIEAANSTSITAPYGISEWDISGLTPDYCSETVKPARVKEAVFSIEAKLVLVKEWDSREQPGEKSGTTVFLEGTRFWVREDATDEERSFVDHKILRPVGRAGGISFTRTVDAFELLRESFNDIGGQEGYAKLKKN